jgi:hypothetical protein
VHCFPNPGILRLAARVICDYSSLPALEARKVDAKWRCRQTVQHFTEVLTGSQVETKPSPDCLANIHSRFRRFNRFLVINPHRPAGQVPQRFKCNFHFHALSIAVVRHFDYYDFSN